MDDFREAEININGHPLTAAQSAVVRMALAHFAVWLRTQESGAATVAERYLERVGEVLYFLVSKP